MELNTLTWSQMLIELRELITKLPEEVELGVELRKSIESVLKQYKSKMDDYEEFVNFDSKG